MFNYDLIYLETIKTVSYVSQEKYANKIKNFDQSLIPEIQL